MKIQIDRSRTNRIIVICTGKLDAAESPHLEEAILSLIEENNLQIVLDLARINHISDAGVQVLQHLFEQAEKVQGKNTVNQTRLLRISNMSEEVRDILRARELLLHMTHQLFPQENITADDFTYEDLLLKIRDFFPSPVSNHMKDAYFSQLINKGLTHLDALKTSRPYWGERQKLDYDEIRNSKVPHSISTQEEIIEELSHYLQGLLIWGHPKTQENVLPPATIVSITGQLFGAIANSNIISDEYSHRFAEAEVEIVSMCAELIGFDPKKATGVFTFGGTATIFYGVKIGIEKALKGAFQKGIRQDAKLICSDAAHYAKLTALGWLGLGMNSLVTVPTDMDNSMDLKALENIMHDLLKKGEKIACIIATMGTTDSFGIDNLEYIVNLRDRLMKQYKLSYKPHIHADAVIGWAFAFFNDYDFHNNPMGFTSRTLQSLWDTRTKLSSINLADSMGIDFHKTGYTPYVSSLFICRDSKDLNLITRDLESMPYLFQYGHYHPGIFTMETSRSGGSVLTALANFKLLGKNGFRTILGHTVSMAGILRSRIERVSYACMVNDYNHGPVTLFRVYPDGVNAKIAYLEESTKPELKDQLLFHNEYNRKVHAVLQQQMEKGFGLALSITERYRVTPYGEPILAIKSYIMSPFTDAAVMEKLISCVEEARMEVK